MSSLLHTSYCRISSVVYLSPGAEKMRIIAKAKNSFEWKGGNDFFFRGIFSICYRVQNLQMLFRLYSSQRRDKSVGLFSSNAHRASSNTVHSSIQLVILITTSVTNSSLLFQIHSIRVCSLSLMKARGSDLDASWYKFTNSSRVLPQHATRNEPHFLKIFIIFFFVRLSSSFFDESILKSADPARNSGVVERVENSSNWRREFWYLKIGPSSRYLSLSSSYIISCFSYISCCGVYCLIIRRVACLPGQQFSNHQCWSTRTTTATKKKKQKNKNGSANLQLRDIYLSTLRWN